MRPNHILPSCFRNLQSSHLSASIVPPKSPSSILLPNEQNHESHKMYAVTKHWFLEDDRLLPTKPHLRDFCRRVATLLHGDRVVCFICNSPESTASSAVSVHLSRIQIQGGKLWQLVLPDVSKSSTKLFSVHVEESALGMLAISDYLYRSHIDFALLDISDTIEIASAAKRWECHDLFIGSLLHIVYKQRLNEPFLLPTTVSLRWLPEAPMVFVQYFCDKSDVILPLLTFPQLIDVLHSAYLTSATRLRDQILQFITVNDSVRTMFDARLLFTLYHETSIPLTCKEYFAAKTAQFFFQLSSQRIVSGIVNIAEEYEGHKGLEHLKSAPSVPISKRSLITWLHNNKILFDTLRRIDENTSSGYDAKDLFWTILHYVEPLFPDKNKIVALLQRICARIDDRDRLLSDESAWKHLSATAMRIVALSLCSNRNYSTALQFSVHISWDSLRTGSSMNNAVGSIAGVKFELKARSTSKRSCSWRLYYSNVEGCLEPRTGLFARVSYELVNSKCCCDDIQILERRTKVRLKDKNVRNGSVRELHTEGELTLLSEKQAEDWFSRHQISCILSIFVRIEL